LLCFIQGLSPLRRYRGFLYVYRKFLDKKDNPVLVLADEEENGWQNKPEYAEIRK
jgi:hypothetical protein